MSLPRAFIFSSFLAFFAGAGAAAARADVLILSNGDHLTGHVIKRVDGKLYFHSDILGDIVAPDNVVTVSASVPASPPSESLAAGLPPQPPKPAPTPAPAAAPAAAKPAVSAAASAVNAPTPSAVAAAAGAAAALASSPAAPAKPPPPPATVIVAAGQPKPKRPPHLIVMVPPSPPWTGKIEFGYDNEATNVRTVTTTVRAQAERTAGPNDWLFKGVYLYGETADQPTTDQDEVDFRWRHNLSERLFTQSLTSYASDKIRLINDNIEEGPSLGYKVYASPRATVDVGSGVIGQYLDATGIQKGYDYLGTVFQDYTYKINGRFTFAEDCSAQYSPQERGQFAVSQNAVLTSTTTKKTQNYEYQFHAELEGKITSRLSLNLHFQYTFDHAVLDPSARADQHITLTLGYGF